MKKTREKRYTINDKENCDLYISILEKRKVELSKTIGILSIGAIVLLGHAISYDNIITLILAVIQGARALLGLTGVIELNDRIKYLNEVKAEYEKSKNFEKNNHNMAEDNGN